MPSHLPAFPEHGPEPLPSVSLPYSGAFRSRGGVWVVSPGNSGEHAVPIDARVFAHAIVNEIFGGVEVV